MYVGGYSTPHPGPSRSRMKEIQASSRQTANTCHSFHYLLLLDNLLTTMLLYSMSPSAASIHLSARCTRPCPGLATNHCTGPGSSFQSRGQVGAPIFGSWCCPRR